MTDPQCPKCRRVTTVERLPWRIGKGGLDCFCAWCSLVFRSDSDDDGPKEAA